MNKQSAKSRAQRRKTEAGEGIPETG